MVDTSGYRFERSIEQEDVELIDGNVLASGDDVADAAAEEEVHERLRAGDIYAWCHVTVAAVCKRCWQRGEDSLGCCSFESEEWLLGSDVYAGMQQEAIAEVVHAPCCDSESAEEDDA